MTDPQPEPTLRGRRILVVEDEYILARDLQRELKAQGAEVLGPSPTVVRALELLSAECPLDGAILDVNLDGEKVFPLVDILRERGVPIVFTTGYSQSALPEAYADVPRYEKPVNMVFLIRALADAAASPARSPGSPARGAQPGSPIGPD